MRRAAPLLSFMLLAAAPETGVFDTAAVFRSVLEPEQARALSNEEHLGALAGALTPQQRQVVESKLRDAESAATEPRDLAAIHKGYLALKDTEGAWRIGDALVGRYPQSAVGFTMRGQAAELRGDSAGAAAQAREALLRNPNDRAAHALLRLTEGRGSSDAATPPSTRDGTSFVAGDFSVAASHGVSAEALSLMEQAVAAQKDRDFPRVWALARTAMNSDPKSETVRRFYAEVEKKRRSLAQEQVGLYAAMRRREAENRAQQQVALDLEAARREARRRGIPPLLPLSAGGVLLALGIMVWNHGLREEARRQGEELKRAGAATLIVAGCAGLSYGATQLLLSAPSAGPPAAAYANAAGVVGRSMPIVAKAGTTAAATVGGAKVLLEGMLSKASGEGQSPENASQQGQTSRPREIKFGSHKSATKWQNQMTQRGWTEDQIREAIERGERFQAPNMVNPSNSATRYVHPTTGRYVVIDDVTNEILQVGADGFIPPAL